MALQLSMERLVRQWTSTQRTRRSTPKGGPLTQLALGLHTVAGQRIQQEWSVCERTRVVSDKHHRFAPRSSQHSLT